MTNQSNHYSVPHIELSAEVRAAVEKCYDMFAYANGDWQLIGVSVANRFDEKVDGMFVPVFIRTKDGRCIETTLDPTVWNSLPVETQRRVFPGCSPQAARTSQTSQVSSQETSESSSVQPLADPPSSASVEHIAPDG